VFLSHMRARAKNVYSLAGVWLLPSLGLLGMFTGLWVWRWVNWVRSYEEPLDPDITEFLFGGFLVLDYWVPLDVEFTWMGWKECVFLRLVAEGAMSVSVLRHSPA
jgi:hypothetical protein